MKEFSNWVIKTPWLCRVFVFLYGHTSNFVKRYRKWTKVHYDWKEWTDCGLGLAAILFFGYTLLLWLSLIILVILAYGIHKLKGTIQTKTY